MFLLSVGIGSAWSQESLPELELLLEQEITIVSNSPQPFTEAAAAVFIISRDELRRSGVTTLPDALRMVPGIQVGQIDSHKYAVTARGIDGSINGRFAGRLLVLVDGRSVYTAAR